MCEENSFGLFLKVRLLYILVVKIFIGAFSSLFVVVVVLVLESFVRYRVRCFVVRF